MAIHCDTRYPCGEVVHAPILSKPGLGKVDNSEAWKTHVASLDLTLTAFD